MYKYWFTSNLTTQGLTQPILSKWTSVWAWSKRCQRYKGNPLARLGKGPTRRGSFPRHLGTLTGKALKLCPHLSRSLSLVDEPKPSQMVPAPPAGSFHSRGGLGQEKGDLENNKLLSKRRQCVVFFSMAEENKKPGCSENRVWANGMILLFGNRTSTNVNGCHLIWVSRVLSVLTVNKVKNKLVLAVRGSEGQFIVTFKNRTIQCMFLLLFIIYTVAHKNNLVSRDPPPFYFKCRVSLLHQVQES